jgi:hypothetical protein
MLHTYMVTIRVDLFVKFGVAGDDQNRPIAGYYKRFGVSAESEKDAIALVRDVVLDGMINWPDSRIAFALLNDLSLAATCNDCNKIGIWHEGGRIFFPED